MISIAVCDDEPIHALRTKDVILRCFGLWESEEHPAFANFTDSADFMASEPSIQIFPTSETLLEAIRLQAYRPHVAVLDIRMEGANGIDLARQINELLPQCAIIFLTAFLEYAVDVYETRHVYFVLKSELEKRIGNALKAALAEPEPEMERNLLLPVGSRCKVIPLKDVLYLERILHRTKVQTKKEQEMLNTTPAKLLESVPEGSFIRCHQSYWVNYRNITALEKNEFVLCDATRIPISRTYRNSAREAFFSGLT